MYLEGVCVLQNALIDKNERGSAKKFTQIYDLPAHWLMIISWDNIDDALSLQIL